MHRESSAAACHDLTGAGGRGAGDVTADIQAAHPDAPMPLRRTKAWATAQADAAAEQAPQVSIVVCTSGRRPAALARCLQSLSRLRGVRAELIVVENRRRQLMQPILVPALPTRFVHEARQGLDIARNRGVAEATADIVVFIDDDCEATPDWLRHVVIAFADRAVACVTGRVL